MRISRFTVSDRASTSARAPRPRSGLRSRSLRGGVGCAAANVLLALLGLGCGSEGARVAQGQLSLPLSTEAGGTTYRLAGASFDLRGPESRLLESRDDEVLVEALVAGDYEIELLDGWELQKLDGVQFLEVEAELTTDSVQSFSISDGATTSLTYAFVTDGVVVPFGRGQLEVGISVTVDPPDPVVIEGNVLVTTQAELDALTGARAITGGLVISGPVTDLAPLSNLESIGGFLGIENTLLENLAGLEGLVTFGDDFEKGISIGDNALLVEIDALAGLTDGDDFSLDVRHNPLLDNVDGFRNLGGRGNLWAIFDNASLRTLEGLSGFTSHSATWIQQNPSLVTLGLTELAIVFGELIISDNDALLGLEGLENLGSAQSLEIDENDALFSLGALESLAEVSEELVVSNNSSLPSCEASLLIGRLDLIPERVVVEGNAATACD